VSASFGMPPRADMDTDGRSGGIVIGIEFSKNGAPIEARSKSWARGCAPVAPGAGIEPALLESKASVLPLDDPERRTSPAGVLTLRIDWPRWPCTSGLGGHRTLASPVKSRVRFRYATSPKSGTRGTRTLISPVKSRVPCPLGQRPMRRTSASRSSAARVRELRVGGPKRIN
jgi:hypothetical protein